MAVYPAATPIPPASDPATQGFADIEGLYSVHLAAVLGCRVVTVLPAGFETALPIIRVGTAGGVDDQLTIRMRLDVETFAATRPLSRDLAEQARAAIRATSHTVLGNGWLIDVAETLNSPFWVDYADDRVRRYMSIYQISSRIRR